MAIQNPSSLYSGGQGILRDNVVDYVTAIENRRKAQEDALDKYYGNLPMTVNAKGVRDQEIPILHEAKNKIQQYWMANRDEIRKGNTPAAYNYGKMFREAQGLVQESKNRASTADKLAKLRGNPKYDYIFRDPKLIEQIDLHERPIGTEGAIGINFDQITLPPPPFDQQKYRQGLADIKPEYDITYEPNPQDKFSKFEVKTPKLNEEQLKRVAQYAATELYNNPSFADEIKFKIKGDPNIAPILQKTFQDKFGRGIENDADLATAYTLNTLPFPIQRKPVSDYKAKKDYELKQAFKKMDYADDLIRGRMDKANKLKKLYYDYTQSGGENNTEGIVTKYINLLKDGAESYKYVTINGQKFGEGKFISPSVTVADKLSVTRDSDDLKYSETVRPDAIYLTDDGKTAIPVRFKRDSEGKVMKSPTGATQLDNRGFNPIPIPNLRVEISKDIIAKKNQGEEVIDEFTVDDPEVRESFKAIESENKSGSTTTNGKQPKISKWDKYIKN